MPQTISVDVIIPVHNAETTIEEAIHSVFDQENPYEDEFYLDIAVCAFNDASTDQSQLLLDKLSELCPKASRPGISVKLLLGKNDEGLSRGAGYARNRASTLRKNFNHDEGEWLCLLDSDDVMKPLRIAEQIRFLLHLDPYERRTTLCGCQFERLPSDATWHYASWANNISDERLFLEQYREITVIQPTWMISRERFQFLGGYVEAPRRKLDDELESIIRSANMESFTTKKNDCYTLIMKDETYQSLRLAEDLRLFHSHMASGGYLKLLRSASPLVLYRHRNGMSQSSQTSRNLLLKLRIKALEDRILKVDPRFKSGFCIWGAGRDGKAFIKVLDSSLRSKVLCIADVDEKKINSKFYINEVKKAMSPKKKRRKENEVDIINYGELPVIVCVAMYRTKGELEENVKSIGRSEGIDLWHFN